jgi:hydrogenase maturation protein HypF
MGSPFTSSAGRLFDGVAAICGVRLEVSYEGQAAIEFEALADRAAVDPYPLELEHRGTAIALDVRPLILAVLGDISAGVAVSTISARFHAGLARATTEALVLVAGRQELDTAVLSGGVFQNRLLLELTSAGLEEAGLRVLVPEKLAPNDGQIAFGQVAVAAARLAAG